MAEAWRQRPDRHYRRYTNPARYPFLLHWGNPRLTLPAKMRTLWGARLLGFFWSLAGRTHLWIEQRYPAPNPKEQNHE